MRLPKEMKSSLFGSCHIRSKGGLFARGLTQRDIKQMNSNNTEITLKLPADDAAEGAHVALSGLSEAEFHARFLHEEQKNQTLSEGRQCRHSFPRIEQTHSVSSYGALLCESCF